MPGRHPCVPIDLAYFDPTPGEKAGIERLVFETDLACTPARLFEIFEDAHAWTVWAPGLRRVEWTSPPPYGQGTTRTVHLRGGPSVYERFIAWETGKLMAFCFVEASEPIWRSFGERYDVTDLGGGRCHWRWTVAYEPAGYFARLHPWIRPAMRLALGWFTKRLQRYVVDGTV